MRNLIKILILIFAAMLQRTVCPYIGIIDIVPDIVTALAAAYVLSSKSLREAGVYGFAAGALEDIMWGRIFGERALLFMYIALIVFYTSEYMYKKTLAVAAFFTFAAYALCESLMYVFAFTINGEGEYLHTLFRVIIPAAAYTSLFEVAFYPLAVKISAIGTRKEELQ